MHSCNYMEEYDEVEEENKYKVVNKKYGYVRNDKIVKEKDEYDDDSDQETDSYASSFVEYSSGDDDTSDAIETSESESSSEREIEDEFDLFDRRLEKHRKSCFDKKTKEYIYESAVTRYKNRFDRNAEEEINREMYVKELYNKDCSPLFFEKTSPSKLLNMIIDPTDQSKNVAADLDDLKLWCKTQTIFIEGKRMINVLKTKRHHKFALIMCPKLEEFESYLDYNPHMAIDHLFKTRHESTTKENLEANLNKILKKLNEKQSSLRNGPQWWLKGKFLEEENKQSILNYSEGAKKMLILISLLKNLKMAIAFIEQCMLFTNANICEHIAHLVVMFGWKDLRVSLLKKLFLPNTEENVLSCCHLIQVKKRRYHSTRVGKIMAVIST